MPSADTFGENYCTNVLVLIIKYISIDGLEDGQTRAVATAVRSEGEARNHESQLRPFLMQSDSASRKRPFSTRLFFDWILLVLLLIVSRVDFIVFVLFLEAVGVREYCCMAVENLLAALCFARSSPATRASLAMNLAQAGWWPWA